MIILLIRVLIGILVALVHLHWYYPILTCTAKADTNVELRVEHKGLKMIEPTYLLRLGASKYCKKSLSALKLKLSSSSSDLFSS